MREIIGCPRRNSFKIFFWSTRGITTRCAYSKTSSHVEILCVFIFFPLTSHLFKDCIIFSFSSYFIQSHRQLTLLYCITFFTSFTAFRAAITVSSNGTEKFGISQERLSVLTFWTAKIRFHSYSLIKWFPNVATCCMCRDTFLDPKTDNRRWSVCKINFLTWTNLWTFYCENYRRPFFLNLAIVLFSWRESYWCMGYCLRCTIFKPTQNYRTNSVMTRVRCCYNFLFRVERS